MEIKKLLPIDIGQLQNKVISAKYYLNELENVDRSEEYKAYCHKQVKNIIDSLAKDFGYIFDTKTFSNGKRGLGLDDKY